MSIVYNGQLVDCDNFRVMLHHISGEQRVAETWEDYQRLLKSGEWFEDKAQALEEKKEKPIEPIVSRETSKAKKPKRKAVKNANGT